MQSLSLNFLRNTLDIKYSNLKIALNSLQRVTPTKLFRISRQKGSKRHLIRLSPYLSSYSFFILFFSPRSPFSTTASPLISDKKKKKILHTKVGSSSLHLTKPLAVKPAHNHYTNPILNYSCTLY